MPIIRDGQPVTALYRGDRPVARRYRGDRLVWRRIITVTPVAPTFHDGEPWITLPTVEGVTYTVAGTPGAGESVTVTATAEDGYELAGQTTWAHTYPLPPYNARINKSGNFTIGGIAGVRHIITGWSRATGYPDTLYANDGIIVEAGTYHIQARFQYNRSATRPGIDLTMGGSRIPNNGLFFTAPDGNSSETSGTVELPAGTVQMRANVLSGSSTSNLWVQPSGTWLHIERV